MRFHDEADLDLDLLYRDLDEAELQPLWRLKGLLPETPRTITPYLWSWKTVKALAERSGHLVAVDKGGDRRVLSLSHPDLDGKPFATPTLWAGIQFLNGRESAPPHRHSPAALRFVMEGNGVWTMVNGDPVHMQPGDLVLTPSFNWHAHDNPGDEAMVWFDGLDLPMIQSLDAVFFEDGPDELSAYDARERSDSESRYPTSGLRPVPLAPEVIDGPRLYSPLLAYRWASTEVALEGLLEADGSDVAWLRYSDPTTGSDVMPTLRAEICRIRAGARIPKQRKVGSSVVLVHRGSGVSVFEGTELRWEHGDVFAVPSWATVEHRAEEQSDLFVLSDTPVLEKIGLARTQHLAFEG